MSTGLVDFFKTLKMLFKAANASIEQGSLDGCKKNDMTSNQLQMALKLACALACSTHIM